MNNEQTCIYAAKATTNKLIPYAKKCQRLQNLKSFKISRRIQTYFISQPFMRIQRVSLFLGPKWLGAARQLSVYASERGALLLQTTNLLL